MTDETRLGVYGLGKLGLPLAASFAAAGVQTFGIDVNAPLVAALRRGEIASREPGLSALLGTAGPALSFHEGPRGLDLTASLIQVPTPSSPDDPSFSARFVRDAVSAACEDVAQRTPRPAQHLVIIASTVMPGTLAAEIRPLVAEAARRSGCRIRLAYVPDLVAIGDVVRGFHKPPCLIIGSDDTETADEVEALYCRIVAADVPRARLSIAEAEMTKVAWNFYFCFKISFANLLARIAGQAHDINVDRLTETLALDSRIGKGFLRAGMAFGGPCFPRDVDATQALLDRLGLDPSIAAAVRQSNQSHLDYIAGLVLAERPAAAGVAGLAFKAGTDETVHSPSFALIVQLLAAGVAVHAHDPSGRARTALRAEPWAAAVTCWDSLDELVAHSDVVVAAVNDPALARLRDLAGTGKTIIDPWGFLPPGPPSLRRPGRAG
ncbi:MAG: nucleotide sugar dehydrogenase [Hyphomicrobiales bacterium]